MNCAACTLTIIAVIPVRGGGTERQTRVTDTDTRVGKERDR